MLILELTKDEVEDWAHMQRVVAQGFFYEPEQNYVDEHTTNMPVYVYTKQDSRKEQVRIAFGDLPLDEMNLEASIAYLQSQDYSITHVLDGWNIMKEGVTDSTWSSDELIGHARMLQGVDCIRVFYGVKHEKD